MNEEQKKLLEAKLQASNVSKHPYNGCDYIQAWHATAEANRIFGFDGWSMDTVYCNEVCRYDHEVKVWENGSKVAVQGFKVGYVSKVRITALGKTREGTGTGSGVARDLFDAIDGACKEAESDAMKRALKSFGNQFGLALYDKTKANVTDVPDPVELTQVFKDTTDAINDLKELEKAGKMDRPEEEKEYIRKRYAKLKKEQG